MLQNLCTQSCTRPTACSSCKGTAKQNPPNGGYQNDGPGPRDHNSEISTKLLPGGDLDTAENSGQGACAIRRRGRGAWGLGTAVGLLHPGILIPTCKRNKCAGKISALTRLKRNVSAPEIPWLPGDPGDCWQLLGSRRGNRCRCEGGIARDQIPFGGQGLC